jgi:hypothetical protein
MRDLWQAVKSPIGVTGRQPPTPGVRPPHDDLAKSGRVTDGTVSAVRTDGDNEEYGWAARNGTIHGMAT